MSTTWQAPAEDEILAQIAAAEELDRLAARHEVRGRAVRYDEGSGWTHVELSNGCVVSLPPDLDEIRGLSPEERAGVWLHPTGDALFWKGSDASVLVSLLLTGSCPAMAGVEPAGVAEHQEPPAVRRKRSA